MEEVSRGLIDFSRSEGERGVGVYTFRTCPCLPETLHEIFQILESEVLLVQLLSIERLAKTPVFSVRQAPPPSHITRTIDSPTRINPPKRLQPHILLLL